MHQEHKTTQHIPTIANSELTETVNSEVELFNVSNKESMQNFMSNLIMELANKRTVIRQTKNITYFAYVSVILGVSQV